MDYEARRQMGLEIQDYLLENTLALIIWMSDVNDVVDWGYMKNPYEAPWMGSSFRRANEWLDMNDPSWQGRPA
jgi:hypothetical protein